MAADVHTQDQFPDIRSALRATWLAASHQVSTAERALRAAEHSLRQAQGKADEVRRQIVVACQALDLDPAVVMDKTDAPSEPVQHAPARRADSHEPRAQYEERVADLLADGRLIAGETLRAVHHGQEHFATIEADGVVSGERVGSKPTLTAAARALVGGERNGWKFWTIQRDGRWVPIADLRRG